MTKARATGTTGGAKGALVVGTGSTTAAPLTVGTDGQVLTAASGQTTGLQWATPASGSMTLLSTTTLSGTSTTISSISQSYRNLFVTTYNYWSTSTDSFYIQANGNNYHEEQFTTTLWSYSKINSTGISNVANVNNNSVFLLYNYSDTTVSKAYLMFGDDAAYGNIGGPYFGTGLINTLSGISSLTFIMNSGTFGAGTVKIYGVN